jgi:signal transduction histidine kinase
MAWLTYVRLIGFTAGTLLMLFWMVVILGYRRQRNFERVFFFLCLALFFFYGGSLLALNAQIYYQQPPLVLTAFSWTVLCVGLIFLPPLLLHLHLEYADTRSQLPSLAKKRVWLAAAYAPALYFGLRAYPILFSGKGFDFLTPSHPFGRVFELWFGLALFVSGYCEWRFSKAAPDERQRRFHQFLSVVMGVAGFVFVGRILLFSNPDEVWVSTVLALLPILPLGVLIYYVQRFNFLQIGRQQNLLYAVSVTFFALLYLSLVRRVSIWLDPILPPEASAAVLLFVLVVFFEPLQRVLGRRLRETAQTEMDQAQRIAGAIQEVARQGNHAKLIAFTQEWLKDKLELADAQFVLGEQEGAPEEGVGHKSEQHWAFPIQRAGRIIGFLYVRPHGAMISGEVRAALEFLCEQLPGALDLCRLIEEKVRLERELAERERMAALGQMAASISHNLKNPLGSIKTILQVQLENPELPDSLRGETRLVLDEISRLSAKLNQLLQFSRPAMAGEKSLTGCDVTSVAKEVTEVLRHEAERKGITLEIAPIREAVRVEVAPEAINDIISNLVVNAIDAAPGGGRVAVRVCRKEGKCLVSVEDDGPGIAPELHEKILQPFFTTKAQGTGLGLAIVARRVTEVGGKVEFESPTKEGRGARFLVWLPLGEGKR